MPLETATYISQLNSSNPTASDPVAQGQNHLNLIKSVLLAQFPNFTAAALASTNAELDAAVSSVLGTAVLKMLAGSAASPGLQAVGDDTTGLFSTTGEVGLSAAGVQQLLASSSGVALTATSITGNASISGTTTSTGAFIGGTGQLCLVGEPRMWLSNTLPQSIAALNCSSANFIWLNGQAISRSSNPILFSMWGTTYGAGDGSSTFNVPNFQQVVPMGRSGMGGASAPALVSASGTTANIGTIGAIVGEGTHTLVVAEMPSHKHTLTDPGHDHVPPGGAGSFVVANDGTIGASGFYVTQPNSSSLSAEFASTTASATTGITMATNGSDGAHNNVQPAMIVNFITLAA